MKIPVVLLTAVLMSGCCPGTEDAEQMISAARAVDEAWVSAYNSQDVDGLMDLYWKSTDLIAYPTDLMELKGWDQVKESYATAIASMPGATAELLESDYMAAGDMVISRGKWKVLVPTGVGPVMEIFGRFSDVKANKDGRWVIIMEHGSVPMPQPEADRQM